MSEFPGSEQDNAAASKADEGQGKKEDITAVLGPAYARDIDLWKGMGMALIFAVILSFIGLGFLNIIDQTPKSWMGNSYDDYTKAGYMDGEWWWLGVTTGCAFVVGILRAAFLMEDPPGFVHEIQTQEVDYHHAPIQVLISAVSLAGGASLGPEAAMGASGAAVSAFLSLKAGTSENERKLNVLAGIAAAFGALMPAAYMGVLLMLEIAHWVVPGNLSNLMMRMTLASTVSYYIFTALEDKTFLELNPLPAAAYDSYEYHNWYLAAAVPLGAVSAAVSFVAIVMMSVFKKVGANARAKGKAATIIYCTLVGLIYGIIGVCLPLTLTSGSAQISLVVQNSAALGKGLITAVIFAKMFTLAICSSSGMVGGFVFPLIFIGSCAGALASLVVSGLPVLLTVSTMMAAVPAAVVPAPIALALLVAQSLILGARDTQPVFVAVFTSHACLVGMGPLTALVQRREARQAAKNSKKAAVECSVVAGDAAGEEAGPAADSEPQEAAIC